MLFALFLTGLGYLLVILCILGCYYLYYSTLTEVIAKKVARELKTDKKNHKK